jgi:uncharacterized protein YunC (DUF1805 family)
MKKKIKVQDNELIGHIIELGPVNLVFAIGKTGLAACGAFDVDALDKFNYPAVKIAGKANMGIKDLQDLVKGTVSHANKNAQKLKITKGQNAQQAIKKLA